MSTSTDLDQAIAEFILLGSDRRVPLHRLADTVQASPRRTGAAIHRLMKLGYPLRLSRTRMVERLSFDPIDAQRLREDLTTQRIGRRIEWRLHVHSTQEELKKLEHETEDGTVLLAETQHSGRGRMGRDWVSPYGGIWMSVLLMPTWPKSHQILNLAFAAAVARAISAVVKISPLLKWPNDLTVRSRKVAGILAEATYEANRLDHLVFGLGLNVNINVSRFPRALRKTSTSLSHELGREIDRLVLARRIIEEMDNSYRRFESGQASELLDEARGVCSTLRRKIRVTTAEGSFAGEALDLGDDGELLVHLSSGATVPFYAADVVHLR